MGLRRTRRQLASDAAGARKFRMRPRLPLLRKAVQKAQGAYGLAVTRDLKRAIDRLQHRQDWLVRCMQVMGMTLPKAVLWSKIRALRRVLD